MPRQELPITIKLSTPINDGTRDISELTINKVPTSGDCRGLNFGNPGVPEFAQVMSRIFGLTLNTVYKIEMADFTEIMGVISDFLVRD